MSKLLSSLILVAAAVAAGPVLAAAASEPAAKASAPAAKASDAKKETKK